MGTHRMNQLRKAEVWRRPGVHLLLLVAETIGVAIILGDGVPLYNQVVRNVESHKPQPGVLWWAVAAVVLVQGSYWLRARFQQPPPWNGHPVIAHVILFMGRLAFVFATSVFSFVFLVNYEKLDVPLYRIVMLMMLLFSMFCWTLDLERFARALGETAR